MELSVETMKKVITDRPGVTNPELGEYFNADAHAIGRCRVKIKNATENTAGDDSIRMAKMRAAPKRFT